MTRLDNTPPADAAPGIARPEAATDAAELCGDLDSRRASSRGVATVLAAPREPRRAAGTGPRGPAVSSQACATAAVDASRGSPGLEATIVLGSGGTSPPAAEPAMGRRAAKGATVEPNPRFGQYELIRELGRGGMGTVHLARDLRLGRLVAIKLLSRLDSYDNARFLSEARVTARCNHENIVVIHDAGEHDGQPYMVFEHVAGQTLRAWLDDRAQRTDDEITPIEPSVAASLMLPVVRALAYAHDMGIVHRDLKPANIMLTDAGTIKVLDFGIAMLVAGDDATAAALRIPEIAEPGAIIGTLPYMSPEQLDGHPVDHRSDIWAVGIMLYQMVTGVHPVMRDGVGLQRALLDITSLDVPVPSVSERRSDLGPLAGVIDRCLLKNRDHRSRDARVLLDELEPIAERRRGAALRHDDNPFAGLAAFQEADADRFYGRGREVGAVLARLRSCPLVVLAGPSGVGKSSLARAGVIPLLKQSGEGWDTFVIRPGHSPLAALRTILVDLRVSTTTGTAAAAPDVGDDPQLGLGAVPGQFGAELRRWAHRKRRRVLVFVDQLEELYTLCGDPAERATFVACLNGVADDAGSPLRVLVSIRSDFLDRLAEHRQFANSVSHGLMLVPPLDLDGLRHALVRPVEAADCRYEDPQIVDEMLAAVAAAPSSLPLLQFAAARLWTERDRERRLLTRASYAAMGGIAGTLASHADTILGAIADRERPLVRAIFERLVTPERTRDVVALDELRELPGTPDDTERLVYRLVDARLLVVESRDGQGRVVELVHESLISCWPTLVGWLHENRDDAAFLSRLRTAATQWQASDHDEGVLWRDEPARRALAWLEHYRGDLGRRERAYLDAVRAIATRVERRRRRIRRRAITVGVAVPVILLAMASVGLVQISRAEREATEQRDALGVKAEELRASLANEAQQKLQITAVARQAQEASEQAQRDRDNAREQTAVAEQASKRAETERDNAQRQTAAAERAAREARAAHEQERRALAAEAAAAERALQSERERNLLRQRAVGPIQQEL